MFIIVAILAILVTLIQLCAILYTGYITLHALLLYMNVGSLPWQLFIVLPALWISLGMTIKYYLQLVKCCIELMKGE